MKLYDNTTENGQNYRNPVLYMDYSDPDVIRVGGGLLHGGVQLYLPARCAAAAQPRPHPLGTAGVVRRKAALCPLRPARPRLRHVGPGHPLP